MRYIHRRVHLTRLIPAANRVPMDKRNMGKVHEVINQEIVITVDSVEAIGGVQFS